MTTPVHLTLFDYAGPNRPRLRSSCSPAAIRRSSARLVDGRVGRPRQIASRPARSRRGETRTISPGTNVAACDPSAIWPIAQGRRFRGEARALERRQRIRGPCGPARISSAALKNSSAAMMTKSSQWADHRRNDSRRLDHVGDRSGNKCPRKLGCEARFSFRPVHSGRSVCEAAAPPRRCSGPRPGCTAKCAST